MKGGVGSVEKGRRMKQLILEMSLHLMENLVHVQ